MINTKSIEDLNKWYEKRDKHELLEELGGAVYWLTVDLKLEEITHFFFDEKQI